MTLITEIPGKPVTKEGIDTDGVVVPTIEEAEKWLKPEYAFASAKPDPKVEVLAIGRAVYNSVMPKPYDSHMKVAAWAAWDYGPNNLWILPSQERLAYPYSILYAISSLFRTERVIGRKADWLFWYDDDVIMPPDTIRKLRNAADPQERPFMAAVGYDRSPDFPAAVWEMVEIPNGPSYHKQWIDMPESGVYRVATTGLCAALFHRSFFERVPQPWFCAIPPQVAADGFLDHRINTDGWMCQQAFDNNVPLYVNCDVKIYHLGHRVAVGHDTAPALRKLYKKGDASGTRPKGTD